MRIDDENKVVWCSDELLDWHSRKVSRATSYYAVADAVDTYTGSKEFKCIFSGSKEFEMYLVAILRGYTFKLEQPQKYYWCKKKEHLAWFEKIEDSYLIRFKFSGELDYSYTLGEIGSTPIAPIKMTEQQARDLLKDDFDKFEKVECE